jgi:hypothetical protein
MAECSDAAVRFAPPDAPGSAVAWRVVQAAPGSGVAERPEKHEY